MEHILTQEDGKKRYLEAVTALSKAFALAVPHDEAIKIRDEVSFFQEARSGLVKATVEGEGKTPDELDSAIQQLVSRAVKVLGDETLKTIAQELVAAVRRSVTIDWTVRENARAQIRVMVKRILRKYGYPPDKQEKATQTVLEQAEVLCKDWIEN
jgi:type I site-specific restriction-modification system R (restriction) subunit